MSGSQTHQSPYIQRRAHTYDDYASSTAEAGASTNRSQSLRDRALQDSDPPLPSYSALMASEAQGVTSSPQPYDARPQQQQYRPPSIDYSLPAQPQHDSYYQPNPSHRLSSGSVQTTRRPVSEPNDLDLAGMRITSLDTPTVSRHQTAPISYQNRGPYAPRQRSVTGDASSVYSLDSGSGVYSGNGAQNSAQNGAPHYGFTNGAPAPPTWDPYPSAGGYAAQPDFSHPYYSAATDFLGLPPGANPPAHASSSSQTLPSRQHSTATLARTNTSLTSNSALSSTSSVSLVRAPTESVGALSTRRRGTQAAVDVSKPPYTKQYVDDYRKRMKDDPDPEAQFAFSKYLIEAAKKIGDELASSDQRLGRKYRDVLLQESLRNIKKLAEGKEPYADAQFFLANLYGTGQLGLGVDHEKAYYLYLMALKLNHPAATYRSAVCNEIGAGTKKDPARAVIFYRKAAGLGDTAAMYKLSMIHLGGLLNAPRNPREAVAWLKRAAVQADEDNPHALHELALLHERPPPRDPNAQVVPHDPNAARELFMQAAQLGYAPAQFKLGACHEFGTLNCPIDPRKSIGWYTRAAEKGDSEAELALSGWYLTGSEGVLKQSDTEAYLWGRKAANKGLAKAEYAVGYYTEIGIGVKQDMELAKRWYMRAAAQQHKRAMQRLTELNNARNPKKGGARPTRNEASSECVIM